MQNSVSLQVRQGTVECFVREPEFAAQSFLGCGSAMAPSSPSAHEVAKYMPQGMQDGGTLMHRSASRFAIAAQNAGVTGDLQAALGALGEVMGACNGCHAGYRLK